MLAMNPLHILTFGDSITAGWTDFGTVYHPYSGKLTEFLQKSLPSYNVTVDVQGLPGDQVVSPPGGFIPRMDILYDEGEIRYDWAIILGGTNDVNMRRSAKEIWPYMQKTWAYPLQNGTKVLALTVPEQGSPNAGRDKATVQLNKLILSYEAENFYTFDLNNAFPYWGLSNKERSRLWADPTHPSSAGYDSIGALIAVRLYELISGTKVLGAEDRMQVTMNLELVAKATKSVGAQLEGRRLRSGRVI